jgi:hypothetical protein
MPEGFGRSGQGHAPLFEVESEGGHSQQEKMSARAAMDFAQPILKVLKAGTSNKTSADGHGFRAGRRKH